MTRVLDGAPSSWPQPGELLPHDPPMVLIDELVNWDGQVAMCRVTLKASFPLVHDGMVPGHFCLELMAQAIGCAAGMLARQRGESERPPVGFVLGGREINFYCDALPVGATLMVEAQHIFGDDKLGNFRSRMWWNHDLVADATMNVYAGRRVEELP